MGCLIIIKQGIEIMHHDFNNIIDQIEAEECDDLGIECADEYFSIDETASSAGSRKREVKFFSSDNSTQTLDSEYGTYNFDDR